MNLFLGRKSLKKLNFYTKKIDYFLALKIYIIFHPRTKEMHCLFVRMLRENFNQKGEIRAYSSISIKKSNTKYIHCPYSLPLFECTVCNAGLITFRLVCFVQFVSAVSLSLCLSLSICLRLFPSLFLEVHSFIWFAGD